MEKPTNNFVNELTFKDDLHKVLVSLFYSTARRTIQLNNDKILCTKLPYSSNKRIVKPVLKINSDELASVSPPLISFLKQTRSSNNSSLDSRILMLADAFPFSSNLQLYELSNSKPQLTSHNITTDQYDLKLIKV